MAENPIRKDDIMDFDSIQKSMNELIATLEKLSKVLHQDLKVSADAVEKSLQGVNAATKEGQVTIKSASTAAEKLVQENKILITQDNQIAQTKAKLKNATSEETKELIRLKLELSKTTQAMKDQIKVEGSAEGSVNKLRARLKELTLAYNKMGPEAAKKAAAEINKLSTQLKKQEAAIGNATRNVGNYSSALKGIGKQLLATAGAYLGVQTVLRGIVSLIKGGVKDIREFDDAFTNVLTLLNEAQKLQFRGVLERGAIDLMATYGFTVEETNQALFDYISATGDAAGAIDFLNKSAIVAIGGNSTLSAVVDGATNVMGAYKDKAGDTTEILNAFFAAQVKGKTTVEELAANIGKVASTAASADIPINELMATFADLTKFLGGTEESATALMNVINAVIAPSKQAAGIFASLGIETGITAVKQSGLLNKLLEVAAAYEGNNDVLTEIIPNIRAFRGIAGLSAEAVRDIEKSVTDLNNTQLSSLLVQEAFNEKMETGARQNKIASGSWKELVIEVGGGESIFKRIGGYLRDEWVTGLKQATAGVKLLKFNIQSFFDIFRKDENKKALDFLKIQLDLSDEIVEESEKLTVKLTDEEKKRQAALDEIRKKAAAAAAGDTPEAIAARKKKEEIDKAQAERIKIATAFREKREKEWWKTQTESAKKFKDFEIAKTETALNEEGKKITIHEESIDELNKIDATKLATMKKQYVDQEALALAHAEAIKISLEDILDDYGEMIAEGLGALGGAISAFASLTEAAKQRELSAVGDNAAAREAIEIKFAKKQQQLAIGQAVVNAALAITEIWRKWAANPVFAAVLTGIAAAKMAGEIALIKSQKFAHGGSGLLDKQGVLKGNLHSGGGVNLGAIGEAERGEYFGIINRRATNKYGADNLAGVFDSINSGQFHNVWSNLNTQMSKGDPYTKKMYELMLSTPSIFSHDGKIIRQYPGRTRMN